MNPRNRLLCGGLLNPEPTLTARILQSLIFLVISLVFGVGSGMGQTCTNPPSSLVGWWPGDGTPEDLVAGRHGANQGGVLYGAAKVRQGFTFNSDDDRVVINHNPGFNPVHPGFTVHCWVKGTKSQPQALSALVEKSHGFLDATGWALQVQPSSGRPRFAIGTGTDFPEAIAAQDILDSQWHHLAGTWDGTTLQLIVDGLPQANVPLATAAFNARSVNLGFAFGGGSAQRFFRGQIDEVAIHSRALSTNELLGIYAAGASGMCKSEPVSLGEALDSTNLVWSSDGPLPWAGQSAIHYDSSDAAQSGVFQNNQASYLRTTVIGPGSLGFWWKVSSETNFDHLSFFWGELRLAQISGETGWRHESFAIPSGTNRLVWAYQKDGSISRGADAAWIDEVSFGNTAGPAIVVVEEPQHRIAMIGDLTQFTVTALGPDLDYQWRRNGVDLPGAIGPALMIQPVTTEDLGEYTVVLSNLFGVAQSAVATLTVLPMELQWQQSAGGPSPEGIYAVHTSPDGFLLGGYSESAPGTNGTRTATKFGAEDFWLVSVSAGGEPRWDASFGGTSDDYLTSMVPAGDGGWLLAGMSNSNTNGNKTSTNFGAYDFWVVRVNDGGEWVWDKTFGGSGGENLGGVVPLPDGSFVLAGSSSSGPTGNKTSSSFGSYDFWLLRIDPQGQLIWDRSYGGTNDDRATAVGLAADGGFLLVGDSMGGGGNKTDASFGNRDFWCVRVDRDGNRLWDAGFGGTNSEVAVAVWATSDGGWVVAGYSSSEPSGNKLAPFFGDYDFWLVRLDVHGHKLWERAYGGNRTDMLYAMAPSEEGGFLLAGYSNSDPGDTKNSPNFGGADAWLIRIDANGNRLWDYTFGGGESDGLRHLAPTSDGGFLLGGWSWSSPGVGNKTSPAYGQTDFWALKIRPYAAASPLRLLYPGNVGADFRFWVATESNRTYRLECSDDLGNSNWQFLETVTGDGSFMPWLVEMTNAPQRFFRLRSP